MAKCCGVSPCNCRVTAGPGVTVTGNGSAANPYTISSEAAEPTTLAVTDSTTVDLGLSGTGTSGDPYTVTADVILDATPPQGGTNLIGEGPDGLYVECADVRTCFSAGDGAAYDPATGEISARLSTDAGNLVSFGTDGGLLATAPAATPTGVQAGDTTTVDTTVSGTGVAGDPYVVSADVIVDPAPPAGGSNLLQAGPDGLYVECADVRGCISAGDGATYDPTTGVVSAHISGDAGNTTSIGTDGGLYSTAAPTALQEVDTATVDLSLTGTGTAGDPFQVSADVILDPTPPQGGTNLLQEGPGGLFVECADVRTCFSAGDGAAYDPATGEISARLSADAGNAVSFGADGGLYAPTGGGGGGTVVTAGDTTTADNSVTGTGTAGDPYVVTTNVIVDPVPPAGGSNLLQAGPDGLYVECADVRGCFSAGDGAAYDPVTGGISARLSADAGNTTVFGADGGLYTPAASTALQAADTNTVDMTVTGTGTSGDPYQVAADVIVAPEPNGLEETPTGLLVAPSADAGNQLAFGADGRLFVPPDPPLEIGCGLQGAGTAASPLAAFPVAGSQPWTDDWSCDPVANSTLKCDPTSGALWTPPEHTSAAVTLQQNHPLGTPTIGVTGGFVLVDSSAWAEGAYTADTLSACRGISFSTRFTGRVELSWPANAQWELGYAVQINGGALGTRVTHGVYVNGPARRERYSFGVSQAAVLPPHTGYTVRVWPVVRVIAGSVTFQQWLTDTDLIAMTR
ncbi:hypothetical protein ACIOHS_27330 [Streptomyces sp. NPDC088253]|uniref:hypothetical protein n=1 Tax=Streptomyces sp. NPDC088253 TaxID=3365846 RepID=UPI003802FAAD